MADKLVEKSGSWFNYGDLRLGQGRENAKQYLRDNPAIADEITAKIIASRQGHAAAAVSAERRRPATRKPGRGVSDAVGLSSPLEQSALVLRAASSGADRQAEEDARLGGQGDHHARADDRHGEERLDQPMDVGRARGGVGPGRCRRADEHGVGAELVAQRPAELDLAVGLHVEGKPERAEVDLGLARVEPAWLGARAGTSSRGPGPRAGRRRSSPARRSALPWPRRQPGPGPADRPSGPSAMATRAVPAQVMPRETGVPTSDGEVDVEQVALEVGLPVPRPGLPQA